MDVVGIVGRVISQGVYSVATPFHPFGGAVDVIVVQQQDGTFRSTPWYVRFGKFQGVLKGSEKIVRINVNGVEAGFHMYLDNSGEAYFVHEVESGKGRETDGAMQGESNVDLLHEDVKIGRNDIAAENMVGIGRLEHSVSDSGVVQLRDECDSLVQDRIERAESDADRRYYEFHNDQSSIEGSVELSEFSSNKFESLDGEHVRESQGADSEVVLFSVDGHVLTAPVSASEQNSDHVRLSTPQFHLGPAEGEEEFSPGDDAWDTGYISELNASATNAEPDSSFSTNGGDSALAHQLEICEGDDEHDCLSKESHNFPRMEVDAQVQSDSEDTTTTTKKREVFKSCLELSELTEQVGEADPKEMGSSIEVQNSQETSPYCPNIVDETKDGAVVELKNGVSPTSFNGDSAYHDGSSALCVEMEANEHNALGAADLASDGISVHSVSISNGSELKDGELLIASTLNQGLDNNPENLLPEDDCSKSEVQEPQRATFGEQKQVSSISRFEISLCGKELHAGMGLDAAARVFKAHRVAVEEFKNSAISITNDENLIVRYEDRYLPWEKAAPFVLAMAAFGLDLPVEPKDAIPVEQSDTPESRDDDTMMTPTSSSRRWRLWSIPFRKVKTLEHTVSNASSEELFVDTESGLPSLNIESTSTPCSGNESPQKQLLRTNVPTNDQIASLNLKDGQNLITFSFSTRVLGTQQVDAHIYLWKWNARIVISDVDGTITKSDVLGQFMPLVGKDWSQSGVAKLFSAIRENGYQLLFLSARAIVQAYLTKSFLFNLKQDGETLPNGPVVISPDGLFPSLYREVIRRAPHEFKIACLEDIRGLFPPDYNPFYAGFGNRDTDELSYRKIGIPKGKIFIINPKGEVAISHRIDVKSYTSLHTLVNDMFPPTSLVEQEDYNAWNFWKLPLPDVEL